MRRLLFGLAAVLSLVMAVPAEAAHRHGHGHHGGGYRHGHHGRYHGRHHHNWSRRYWDGRYGCYLYLSPDDGGWYYWCQPDDCYYPLDNCPYGRYAW